jgi:hypothetical protein
VRTYGGSQFDTALSVSRFGASDLVLCGVFTGNIMLGLNTLPTNGGADVFIARLGGVGNVLWAGRLGGPNDELPVASVASVGSAAVVLAHGGGDIRFPDGTHRSSFGTQDGLLYQQPLGSLPAH